LDNLAAVFEYERRNPGVVQIGNDFQRCGFHDSDIDAGTCSCRC
jgi:hypothetical protein